jgi:DNA polymerase-3 subunit epsilon
MTPPPDEFAALAQALEKSGDYRVLRRVPVRTEFREVGDQPTKVGVLLDLETTGLDTTSDEVVELGMIKFSYLPSGEVVSVVDTFSSLNDPKKPIPEDAMRIHGITNEMVAGHRIDPDLVEKFVSDAAIVIAHNANFDRRLAERYWAIFVDKPWACSVSQIQWRSYGFEGSRLSYLLSGVGMFHEAHRAVDDCRALLEVLAFEIPDIQRTTLSLILEAARKSTARIWAERSPFDLKDELKKRGYRWSPGDDGRPKAWYVDVEDIKREEEIQFLKANIYGREIDLNVQLLTAMERFSVRA